MRLVEKGGPEPLAENVFEEHLLARLHAANKRLRGLRTIRTVLEDVLEDMRAAGALDDDDKRLDLAIANLAAMERGT